MKLAGIQSVIRRKRKKYVKSTPQQVAENHLNREFTAEESNEKWLTDVTEIQIWKRSESLSHTRLWLIS
jgi:putative transposase